MSKSFCGSRMYWMAWRMRHIWRWHWLMRLCKNPKRFMTYVFSQFLSCFCALTFLLISETRLLERADPLYLKKLPNCTSVPRRSQPATSSQLGFTYYKLYPINLSVVGLLVRRQFTSHNSHCEQFTEQNSPRIIHYKKIKIPLDEFLIWLLLNIRYMSAGFR
jgi:hypothetical protein